MWSLSLCFKLSIILAGKLGGSLGSINKTTVISKTIYLRETLPLGLHQIQTWTKWKSPTSMSVFMAALLPLLVSCKPQVYSFSPSCSRIFRLEVGTSDPTRWWHQRTSPPTHPKRPWSIVFFCSFGVEIDRKIEHCSFVHYCPTIQNLIQWWSYRNSILLYRCF